MTDCDLHVVRYSLPNPADPSRPSGDFLRVGSVDLGAFRDLVDAEFQRANGNAFDMCQMWYTGSPYGAEILALARLARGDNVDRPPLGARPEEEKPR